MKKRGSPKVISALTAAVIADAGLIPWCLILMCLTGENVTILTTVGAENAVVNGKSVRLDSPAFIENGRTYTLIRFISEKLGASVEWAEKELKVVITK